MALGDTVTEDGPGVEWCVGDAEDGTDQGGVVRGGEDLEAVSDLGVDLVRQLARFGVLRPDFAGVYD